MNRQVNPNHGYEVDGVIYTLVPDFGTPEWWVMKNHRKHQLFTSLAAAKGWLEHVLDHPASDKTYPNGAPMFAPDGMMLDEQGKRSIFDDVDEEPIP